MVNNNKVTSFVNALNGLVDGKEDVANKVTSISSSSTNTHYPTAKAVYDALADVTASSGGNYIYDFYLDSSTDDIVLEYDSASGGGSGGGSSVDIVTAWESTPSDSKVASEKLTKDTLDTKIAKSSTTGLVKNDGTIDTSAYITSSALSNYIQKSSTSGLVKNNGTIDTNTYLTSSAIANMLTSSDVVDNLTSTSANAPLSAKQGKVLKDYVDTLVGNIEEDMLL